MPANVSGMRTAVKIAITVEMEPSTARKKLIKNEGDEEPGRGNGRGKHFGPRTRSYF